MFLLLLLGHGLVLDGVDGGGGVGGVGHVAVPRSSASMLCACWLSSGFNWCPDYRRRDMLSSVIFEKLRDVAMLLVFVVVTRARACFKGIEALATDS